MAPIVIGRWLRIAHKRSLAWATLALPAVFRRSPCFRCGHI